MEWKDVLNTRISCRKYAERPVEREKVLACVEAARLAPSGHNSQRWRFIVVDDADKRARISEAAAKPGTPINRFCRNIPVLIVLVKEQPAPFEHESDPCLNENRIWDVDMGIAAEHICLEATSQGLGSIILGRLSEPEIKETLDIPQELEVPLIVGIGYALNPDTPPRPRRPLSEVACYNSYKTAL